MIELKSYGLNSKQGPCFEINEDYGFVDLHNNLFLVFDGFGGINIGDSAVKMLTDDISTFYTKIGGDPDSTFPFYYSYKYLLEGNALVNAMYSANENLKAENLNKKLSERGGASFIGATLSESILTIASTGNCMGSLYRHGALGNIVSPDILSPILPVRHDVSLQSIPLSGFGLFDDLHIQVKELKIKKDDLVILMTDGAYGLIDDDELKYILEKKNASLNEKSSLIFDFVNQRGNLDNQTLLFLQF